MKFKPLGSLLVAIFLIRDALLAHGYRVEEIESLKLTRPHGLTPWARLKGSKVTYPPAQGGAQQGADTLVTEPHLRK